MKPRICTPVTGSTRSEFFANLSTVQELSDLIELRIDMIPGVTVEDLEKLRQETKKEAILTCRTKDEGGNFTGTQEQLIEILQKAFNLDFAYVDVELQTLEHHAFYKGAKTKMIVSYHNFDETPVYYDMTKIVDDMKSYNPDIIKIATMVKKDQDNYALLKLLTNRVPPQDMIVLGMGDKGKVTRVLSPFLGGYLTFASTEKGASAPGQIPVTDLETLYNTISKFIS